MSNAENDRVLQALKRLGASLQDLPDKKSPPHLSHWRVLSTTKNEALTTAWQMLDKGNQLIRGTSTKFTLITNIDVEEGSKLAKDLLQGSELLGTAAMVVHDDAVGCSRSWRKLVKHSVRAVVNTCISLMDQQQSSATTSTTMAQRTGAIWDACDRVAKLPKNNRNAMRRDLLTWMVECQETMQEFSDLLQVVDTSEEGAETTWDMFCAGQSEAYSEGEQPIAVASLALIKCSRGSIKVALQACEVVGESADNEEDDAARVDLLTWILTLHELARNVGDGMTDLGANMYAPLELEDLQEELTSQASAIAQLHEHVLLETSPVLPAETVEMSTNIRGAAAKRVIEAQEGIGPLLS
jgi:hypothetical protein